MTQEQLDRLYNDSMELVVYAVQVDVIHTFMEKLAQKYNLIYREEWDGIGEYDE